MLIKHRRPPSERLWRSRIDNDLPNSGAVVGTGAYESVEEIVRTFDDPRRRRIDVGDHAGFAVDDAVWDPSSQAWERWSFARLGRYLADLAYREYENPRVLEFGFGPAHLFHYLWRFGIRNYIGVDGNPYALSFNPETRYHPECFLIFDLQECLRLRDELGPVQADLVCCFEVLEHIVEDKIDNLLESMHDHMHERSLALCTASLQDDMDVHVLVRPRRWWIERFRQHGLVERDESARLVERMGRHHPFNWSPANTNMFALVRNR